MRYLDANIKTTLPDYVRKAAAFFRYAEHDDHMASRVSLAQSAANMPQCQSHDMCAHVLDDKNDKKEVDEDAKYVAQYLGREYYVS